MKKELKNQSSNGGGGGGGGGGGRGGGGGGRGGARGGRGGGRGGRTRSDLPTENELGRPVWVRRDAMDLARNPVCVNWR